MLVSNVLLPSVLLPLATAATVMVFLTRLSSRASAGSAWAVAVAFATTFLALTGPPRIPPIEATQRLLLLVVAAPLIVDLASMGRRQAVVRTLQIIALAVTVFWLVQTLVTNSWSATESAARIAIMLALAVLVLIGVRGALVSTATAQADRADEADEVKRADEESATDRSERLIDHPAAGRFFLLVLLAMTSAALGLAGSARLSFLMLGATVGFATVEAFQMLIGRHGERQVGPAWRDGHELSITTITLGLLIISHHYAELTVVQTLLLVAAFGLLRVPGRARALAILPATITVALLAYTAFTREDDPYDYYSSASCSETCVSSAVEARDRSVV